MRLGHVLYLVGMTAFGMSLCRDPIGRVFVIVFTTGVAEIVVGLAAIMTLFQSIGAIGQAKSLLAHAEALAITSVVLAFGTIAMTGCVFVGFWLVAACV